MYLVKPDYAKEAKVTPTGDFNTAPVGFAEITQKEFAQSNFFRYGPEAIEHRQLLNVPGEKTMLAVWMYYYHDGTGLALAEDFWAGTIRYFRFGCDHDYRELSPEATRQRGLSHFGHCWHTYECQTCGHIEAHDSSD